MSESYLADRSRTFHNRGNYCSNPNTATPFGVPTKTWPFATIGVMNLLPVPNGRASPAWLLL